MATGVDQEVSQEGESGHGDNLPGIASEVEMATDDYFGVIDYIEVNEAVTFGLSMVVEQVCVDVQVFEDWLVEANETIGLFVTSDDPAILLLTTGVEILIVNTDGKFSLNNNNSELFIHNNHCSRYVLFQFHF